MYTPCSPSNTGAAGGSVGVRSAKTNKQTNKKVKMMNRTKREKISSNTNMGYKDGMGLPKWSIKVERTNEKNMYLLTQESDLLGWEPQAAVHIIQVNRQVYFMTLLKLRV